MPSLTKDALGRSPYWICCYNGPDKNGQPARLKRSTKCTDKDEAWTVCVAYERAAHSALKGSITERQVREVISQTLERVTGRRIYDPTIRQWLDHWISTEQGTIEPSSLQKYRQAVREFVAHLGRRADLRLEAVTVEDVLGFRESILDSGRGAKTANGIVRKILNRPFRLARDQGIITTNPVAGVKTLRDASATKKTFRPEQLRQLLDCAKGDWEGLILAGYYTGGRLIDLARLQWSNVNLTNRFILFRQKKTQRHASKSAVQIPIHPQLKQWLRQRAKSRKGSSGDSPVFPELYDKGGSGKSGLSMAFMRIMAEAGVDPGKRENDRGGKGRSVSALSFHSLRHSFNSALANAGVSQELRQKLTGHASAQMNTIYTHHELDVIRLAVEKIKPLPKKHE